MVKTMQWILDLMMFLFPVNCLVCGKRVNTPSCVLCYACELNMPMTGYLDRADSPVCQVFWGRVRVSVVTSLFRFEKGSVYRSLLHDLKYRGNRRAGYYLGKLLGIVLRSTCLSECDLLVPVPLHRKKLRERGYNQSEVIAQGVSAILGIPVTNRLLIRRIQDDSQTTMGRYERFNNVQGSFQLNPFAPDLSGKKVLLIDDVLTTGSTLEECSAQLLFHFDCQVYIATACHA